MIREFAPGGDAACIDALRRQIARAGIYIFTTADARTFTAFLRRRLHPHLTNDGGRIMFHLLLIIALFCMALGLATEGIDRLLP